MAEKARSPSSDSLGTSATGIRSPRKNRYHPERTSLEREYLLLRNMAGYAFLKAISFLPRNLVGFGDHHQMRPGYPFKPFPEEPPGEMPFIAERTGSVDEKDVHIPSHTAVLEGIIRHRQGNSPPSQEPPPLRNDWGRAPRGPPGERRREEGAHPPRDPAPPGNPEAPGYPAPLRRTPG